MWFQDPSDQVHDEPGVAADLLDFMQEFQKARPHLADRDFFVTGESYGVSRVVCANTTKLADCPCIATDTSRFCWVLCLQGHYVPAFAAHIYHTNKFKDPSKVVNLKGIAIGNGLTDPGAFVVGGDVLLVL